MRYWGSSFNKGVVMISIQEKKNKFDNRALTSKIRTFKWKRRYALLIPFLLFSTIMVIIPLIFVLLITLIPTENSSVGDNWNILTGDIWLKILNSLWISIVSTILCILIAYPFCYFLSQTKSKTVKKIIFLFATMPMWLGSLIILIALKSLLDKINGALNSTYGHLYTIIGIIYLYIPYMMIPLYNSLENMPKNLVFASKDLGRDSFVTFFRVVVPYTKQALIAGITLVLLPSISVVAVPKFLNNSPGNSLIGDIIMDQGMLASESNIALARACVLSVTVSMLMLVVYLLIVSLPKIYTRIVQFKSKITTKKSHIKKSSERKK